ncbi:MAG: LamG-like jellyroll fold domain-containing protein [Kiritimatiellia bacterium]
MKKIVVLGMLASLLNAVLLHAQETNTVFTAESANAIADTNAGATTIAIAATNAVNTNSAAGANVLAAADSKPSEDAAQNMIAHFPFDAGITPDPTVKGFDIPAVFQRESPAFLNGQELGAHKPRLVAGKFGQGLLLEAAHANLYNPSQAGAEDATLFQALNGSALAETADKPWEGKQALTVTTKGEAEGEGAALEVKVGRALYNGAAIVPACYVASVYLKGQGNLKMFLKDMDSDKPGESVYVDLTGEWKRFACTFRFSFPAMAIGPKHEADWETLLPGAAARLSSPKSGAPRPGEPPGTNIEARLQLAIVTTENSKTAFQADGLQLEMRHTPYAGTRAGPAPHVWIPGGQALTNETILIGTKGDAFGGWRKNGTISFWFLPNWDVRDGTQDTIFQTVPSLTTLQHVNGKLQLTPGGTAFAPSDWQNNWHHVAVTWNAEGTWVLYVDSLDYPNDETMKRPMTSASAIVFGGTTPVAAANGVIDDLMLFQIALTPEQVGALFAGELLKPGGTAGP